MSETKRIARDLLGETWQNPVLGQEVDDPTAEVPAGMDSVGARVIVGDVAAGDFSGFDEYDIVERIATGVGAANWLQIVPIVGMRLYDISDGLFYNFTTEWKADAQDTDILISLAALTIIDESFIVGNANDSVTAKTPAEVLAVLSGEGGLVLTELQVGAGGDEITQIVYDADLKAMVFTITD